MKAPAHKRIFSGLVKNIASSPVKNCVFLVSKITNVWLNKTQKIKNIRPKSFAAEIWSSRASLRSYICRCSSTVKYETVYLSNNDCQKLELVHGSSSLYCTAIRDDFHILRALKNKIKTTTNIITGCVETYDASSLHDAFKWLISEAWNSNQRKHFLVVVFLVSDFYSKL